MSRENSFYARIIMRKRQNCKIGNESLKSMVLDSITIIISIGMLSLESKIGIRMMLFKIPKSASVRIKLSKSVRIDSS